MLTAVEILGQLLLLGAAALAFLTIVGFGVTELILPAAGHQLLLAPAVGLAVLMLGIQWISFVAPPAVAAIVVFAATAPLTAALALKRRSRVPGAWRDVAAAGGIAILYYVALLQIVVQRGMVTLASFPADNIFIYAQAAQYLRDHPMPSNFHAVGVSNPGSFYLTTVGTSFPNSVGAIDAAASVLTGRPVYAVFDPLSALALALTVGGTWYFVRVHLAASWPTASAAALLLAASQLLYWAMGVGVQQESLAMPIMTAALCTFTAAIRSGSLRAGALTGVLAASLIGLYLPIAVLLVVCAVVGGAAWLLGSGRDRWRATLRVALATMGAGIAASLASLYVLVFEGGLQVWLAYVGSNVAAGGISRFPTLPYVLGTLPFAHVWELKPMPLGHVESELWGAIVVSSVLFIALLLAGVARAVFQQRTVEAALLVAGMLFVAYEAGVAHYPYGFVKTLGYVAPLTSAFVAFGAGSLGEVVPKSGRKAALALGWCALAIVLVAAANASRDMLHLWLDSRPALTSADLRAENAAAAIPDGATVFVDEPAIDYGTLIRAAAIAYFLPDRNVRVYVGEARLGTFENQDVFPQPCAFDFVISAQPPAGQFTQVYFDAGIGVGVYKRVGPRCAGP